MLIRELVDSLFNTQKLVHVMMKIVELSKIFLIINGERDKFILLCSIF